MPQTHRIEVVVRDIVHTQTVRSFIIERTGPSVDTIIQHIILNGVKEDGAAMWWSESEILCVHIL